MLKYLIRGEEMKINKMTFKIVGGLLLVGLLYIATMHVMIKSVEDEMPMENAQYLIVLGARLYGDYPSPALRERLDTAVLYLKENHNSKVIVTGGQGPDELIPEAIAMKDYLVRHGINQDRIIVEDKSTSTFENLKLAKEIILNIEDEVPSIVIVSNRFHLFRARLIARRMGLEPTLLGAEIPPTIVLSSYFREYLAVTKSLIFDF